MSGHTKGPWVVSCSVQVYSTGSGRIVAQPYTDSANGPVLAMDEQKANANLIAAAPDLLEALEAMLDRYTGLVNCGDCGYWDAEAEVEVMAARKSIARAKGEAK